MNADAELQPWIVLWRDRNLEANRPHHIWTGMAKDGPSAVARVMEEDRSASIVYTVPGIQCSASVNEFIRGDSWDRNDPSLLAKVATEFAGMLKWLAVDAAARPWVVLYRDSDLPSEVLAFTCQAITAEDARAKCRMFGAHDVVSAYEGEDIEDARATYKALQAARERAARDNATA